MVLLFERLKADALVRGVLVEEQNGLALLDNDIGVQRLADDAEGLFRDRKRLLCFRLFDGFGLRLGPDLNLRFGLRLRSDLRLCFRLRKRKALLRRHRLGTRQLHRRGQHGLGRLLHRLLRSLTAVFGCLHGLIEAGLRRLDSLWL